MSSPDDEFLDGIMLHAVWGSSSSDVYAVGSEWTILHYDGIEWSRIESGGYSDTGTGVGGGFWSVWGSSANDIYAVGGRVVLHFDGHYWREIALPDTHLDHYDCVWGTSAENVYILGGLGRIYHYNGSTWQEMNIGQSVNLTTIWGTSNNDVFAAGYNGTIFHYDGEEWSQMFGLMDMHFRAIWGSSTKNVYAAGYRGVHTGATYHEEGVIYHYNGTKWKRIKIVNGDHLGGIWGHGDGDVFVVGSGRMLHYSGMPIFPLALGAVAFGLWILGWRFIRKKNR
jgi:hypothetical protein